VAAKGTPATAAAERAGIAFRVHEYRHDPGTESYGLEAAQALGVDAARVLKTLVAEVEGQLVVCCAPVEAQLDLKAVAATAGRKRAVLAAPAAAERASGYVVGGISPLGQKRRLPTFVDDSALAFETVFVSAGRRGLELELSPRDLLALTGGLAVPLARRL
jgi:Cys-tRNA(Pro)/Cys-tRNA(Cys) deacylase